MDSILLITVILTAVVLVVGAYVVAKLVGPRSYNPVKGQPFECGIPTRGTSWIPVHVGYYLFAILFLMFDIETLFLYPWAVVVKQFGAMALASVGFFMLVLVFGLADALTRAKKLDMRGADVGDNRQIRLGSRRHAGKLTEMVHDTGVFQYSSTSPETMRIAGELMKTGFNFSKIIDESFYQKTYVQNQVMGRVLAESILLLDGKCIIGYLKKRDMEFYGVDGKDLDGIVSQLRLTAGVEVAMFIYEVETQSFKVSLRSNGNVDVSKIAVYFGGGGHMRAAGCDLQGSVYDVINNVTEQICKQFQEQEV